MEKSYRHLNVEERALIEVQLRYGARPGEIAVSLKRARSTVLREIRRNGWLSEEELAERGGYRAAGGYRCVLAERRAQHLTHMPRIERKLVPGNDLWKKMIQYLSQGLSPVQISRTLARMPKSSRLSHETIYTTLYAMPRGELRASLLSLMRRRHRNRRTQRGTEGPRKSPIPDMTMIDQRPPGVLKRRIPGHWEGDMIVGKGNLSQVGTLVERKTLFVALVKLPSPRPEIAAKAFSKILNRFDSQLRRSMTYDQGSEMRHHKRLTQKTGVEVYFAHPHTPWERGISENTNGLLRQYLPKGTDLSTFSQKQLDDIAWKLNTRPRKTLGWKAPAELFLPRGSFNFVQYWSQDFKPVALVP